jgi:tRNA threonylcarbamoyl adenosine modification protein YeaZ
MDKTHANRTLVVECASEACSVALFESGELLANEHQILGRGHAERLIPMIAGLPDKGKAGRILVSLGPGSFTGVRIGIASARALGIAWGSQVLGYPTMTLVAASCFAQTSPQPITVCMNGGHGEWFVQNFSADLVSGDAVRSLPPADAAQNCRHGLIAGNRAKQLGEICDARPMVCETWPNASAALLLPDDVPINDLTPIYGRGPDAKLPAARKPAA